tara:strand:- start:1281 stop:1541 length:261 start_codon:yes stop_codon:yes gene_type:complete
LKGSYDILDFASANANAAGYFTNLLDGKTQENKNFDARCFSKIQSYLDYSIKVGSQAQAISFCWYSIVCCCFSKNIFLELVFKVFN